MISGWKKTAPFVLRVFRVALCTDSTSLFVSLCGSVFSFVLSYFVFVLFLFLLLLSFLFLLPPCAVVSLYTMHSSLCSYQCLSLCLRDRVLSLSFFLHLVVAMGILHMGTSGRFPQGKPAASESRYPTLINYKVYAGSFRVFVIHRTLTWTTGSVMCVIILMRVYTHLVLAHRQRVSTTFLTRKKTHNLFLFS